MTIIICKIQMAESINMKEITFQYSYIKAQLQGQYSGFQVYHGHLEFKHGCNKFNIVIAGNKLMLCLFLYPKNVIKSSLIYL